MKTQHNSNSQQIKLNASVKNDLFKYFTQIGALLKALSLDTLPYLTEDVITGIVWLLQDLLENIKCLVAVHG